MPYRASTNDNGKILLYTCLSIMFQRKIIKSALAGFELSDHDTITLDFQNKIRSWEENLIDMDGVHPILVLNPIQSNLIEKLAIDTNDLSRDQMRKKFKAGIFFLSRWWWSAVIGQKNRSWRLRQKVILASKLKEVSARLGSLTFEPLEKRAQGSCLRNLPCCFK